MLAILLWQDINNYKYDMKNMCHVYFETELTDSVEIKK